MRTASLLALGLLLAGCTQYTPDEDIPFVSCPFWIQGLSSQGVNDRGSMTFPAPGGALPSFERWDVFKGNGTTPGQGFGSGALDFQGHPLDQLVFDFRAEPNKPLANSSRILYIQDGEMTLEFLASDDGFPGEVLQAYDEALGPSSKRDSWVFTSDPATKFSIYNITLRLDLAGSDQAPNPRAVFAHWTMSKVNQDGDSQTTTTEVIRYSPEMWYRTCSADGTQV